MAISFDSTVWRNFMAKVEQENGGCWQWTGAKKAYGYGQFMVIAHRFAYEMLVGPIEKGKQLDHLCNNPSCINPAHLKPATAAENSARGRKATTTHCPHGHSYDIENTYLYVDKRGYRHRMCRACTREANYQRQLARAKKRGGKGYPPRKASSS